MTCPFCEEKAFSDWTNRHIHKKPFGFKKILVTLEKKEIEHLEEVVESTYQFDSVQHYLRVLIDKDRNRVHQIKYRQSQISKATASDI